MESHSENYAPPEDDCPGRELPPPECEESSDMDIRKARDFLKQREEERQSFLRGRFQMMTKEFETIVAEIVERFPGVRVWQWGSLLDQGLFSEISDIDIGIEGVKSMEDFSRILEIGERISKHPLDIIQLEKLGKEEEAFIKSRGRVVYEPPEKR